MEIVKYIEVFIFFMLGYNILASEKQLGWLFIKSIQVIAFTLFLRTLLSSNRAVLQFASVLDIASLSYVCGVILGRGEKNSFLKNWGFLLILVIQLFHYLVDNIYGVEVESFSMANQSGFLVSLIFCLSYCFPSRILLNIPFRRDFVNTIISVTWIGLVLLLLTYTGFLKGNTLKTLENTGGVGLQNLSTNETGLLGLSCLLFHYMFSLKRIVENRTFSIVNIFACFVIILLTRSRIAMISTVVITVLYFLPSFKKSPLRTAMNLIALFAIFFPVIDVGIDTFKSRVENDTADFERIAYSNVATELGFTFSGRVIIWEAYLIQFLNMDILESLLGTGFNTLIDIYKKSYLTIFGDYILSNKANFFPLHSDFCLLFITGGYVSLSAWLVMMYKLVRRCIQQFQFISMSSCFVLFFYFLMDMLNYSAFQSLLLGLGILQINFTNYYENNQKAS